MTSVLTTLTGLIIAGSFPFALQAEPDLTIPPADTAVIAQPADTTLSEEARAAILVKAAAALSAAETAKGDFSQVAPNGNVTTGSFALRRPGRMRFDYDAPTPVLIVADGATVAMEDRELETVDRIPLASTPLGLVLDDELDFQTEAEVTDVTQTSDRISISMRDRTGEADGELTLIFDAANYDLLGWTTFDADRQTTTVALQDVETNVSIDPRLFRIEDPADDEDER